MTHFDFENLKQYWLESEWPPVQMLNGRIQLASEAVQISCIETALEIECMDILPCLTYVLLKYYVICSIISAVGLIENNSVILVASMLISPLMVIIIY